MRYGSAKAEACPGAGLCSFSLGLGDEVGRVSSGVSKEAVGGGSIAECVIGCFDGIIGSGKAGMASSAEDVSIVILVVDLGDGRKV